jgi:hypothetical protein
MRAGADAPARHSCYEVGMNKPLPVPENGDSLEWPGEAVASDAEDLAAIADLEAGRSVSHAAVVRWLKSWGAENELPSPQCGD